MTKRKQMIEALVSTGEYIAAFLGGQLPADEQDAFDNLLKEASAVNPWFDRRNLLIALQALAENLQQEPLERYAAGLHMPDEPRTVAVIMAGNIPLVGFHDWLTVLLSSHRLLARTSSKDELLLPYITALASRFDAGISRQVRFEKELIKDFDAVIATGSNNSARYFETYFAAIPSIIRHNRNSVAIIHPDDEEEVFRAIASDIFYYYGLGCRSVSQLLIPQDFDMERFIAAIADFSYVAENYKYFNNYEYNKSIMLINGLPHYDSGFALFMENGALASPVSVVHYRRYQEVEALRCELMLKRADLQCIVDSKHKADAYVQPGKSQFPTLFDFADGVDVRKFLNELHESRT